MYWIESRVWQNCDLFRVYLQTDIYKGLHKKKDLLTLLKLKVKTSNIRTPVQNVLFYVKFLFQIKQHFWPHEKYNSVWLLGEKLKRIKNV